MEETWVAGGVSCEYLTTHLLLTTTALAPPSSSSSSPPSLSYLSLFDSPLTPLPLTSQTPHASPPLPSYLHARPHLCQDYSLHFRRYRLNQLVSPEGEADLVSPLTRHAGKGQSGSGLGFNASVFDVKERRVKVWWSRLSLWKVVERQLVRS
ncbi:hypothetical protein E2C01_032488 [Portunus trituberculatus]|uniref:Uncharacterized protein n=1 Tax=Portunus trituberculatus TaxID=210409 RepID=A0A5B7F160_PORTR|nr:hypothetical protein [Portunus trituberculatus]